jgi:ureidoacrylate peracid hydrolase
VSTAFSELDERIDPKHTVLMVIDVQNDFAHQNGSPGRRQGDIEFLQSVVPPIQALTDAAHRHNVPVIYTQATHNRWTNTPTFKERYDAKMRIEGEGFRHCEQGSWGWEFFELKPTEDDLVLLKPRYSSFYQTHLELTLIALQTRTIVFTGIATGGCVNLTARDAWNRDYAPVIAEDGTSTFTRERQEQDIKSLSDYCLITRSNDVIDAWARRGPGPDDWKRPF